METDYDRFVKSKIIVAENYGFDTSDIEYSEMLKPHQKDIVNFCLEGGRRAIFASFGLGKSMMQLELAKQVIAKTQKPFLIVCPLGVSGEFKRDNSKLNTGLDIQYITDTDSIEHFENKIYLSNYERVRKGDIIAECFGGVSFDEASILRSLKTETTNYVLEHFTKVPYRFVATATPTPNDYIEILNYAVYLGVVSRGHALTRFFQRDSQKAGNLKLYENKKEEFWAWVSTWAAFIDKPSDLGYSDEGYDLPKLNIIEHCLTDLDQKELHDKWGNIVFFKDSTKSLIEVSKEKRETIIPRMTKAVELAKSFNDGACILWHHLESERECLQAMLRGENYVSLYGALDNATKEEISIKFSENQYDYLLTKDSISGSGCNYQNSHNQIHTGITYKFNNFIQSIHRQYRYGQTNEVNVHIIYTFNESHIYKTLLKKWENHKELVKQMTDLVKKYGLNSNIIRSQMERKIFKDGKKIVYDNCTLYNNDCVIACDDIADNSQKLIVTSIPFGDHYEYSDNYNDFGHNHGNKKFFEQMDFLIPKLHRVLEHGRIAAIHVKDRIRYSYQNGTKFTTISDFSGQTVQAFEKHGFFLIGKITVTTDVVAENNQTYRLGWTEQCKDASKNGVGLPEYVLLFRKPPSHLDNAYADTPIEKEKTDYTKALWQLDAHAYWRSSGDRFLNYDELKRLEVKQIVAAWKKKNKEGIYDFMEHLRVCTEMDELEKLSSTFMTLPVHSNNDNVWTDINRMNTLNTIQANTKKEKHICPLQFDIIERLINRFSMKGETVFDPFGGLFSVAYKALEMERKAVSIELNSEYFHDGLHYVKSMMLEMDAPKLFDFIENI